MKERITDCSVRAEREDGERFIHPAVVVVIGLAFVMVMMVSAGLWQLRKDILSGTRAGTDDADLGAVRRVGARAAGGNDRLAATRDDLREGRLQPRQMRRPLCYKRARISCHWRKSYGSSAKMVKSWLLRACPRLLRSIPFFLRWIHCRITRWPSASPTSIRP